METSTPARPRNDTIDWLRGLVMVLMALDHTRDFLGDMSVPATDLAQTNPLLFFTRVVTHLCAPTFVFLTGVGAFLMRGRGRTTGQLSLYLLTRGLWLVVLEFTWVHFCWELYSGQFTFLRIQVIAAIGFGMIALAGLVWLPRWLVGVLGLVVVFGHNTTDPVTPESFGRGAWVWRAAHAGGPVDFSAAGVAAPAWELGTRPPPIPPGGVRVWVAYPLLPWAGVMALGYAAAPLFQMPQRTRRAGLLAAGLSMLFMFAVLRGGNAYGDPQPWPAQSSPGWALMAMMNCEKYPPSLAYVLMTLGVAALLAAAADRPSGPPGKWVVTLGRVPMFFYLLHLPVIHLFMIGTVAYGRSQGWYPNLDDLSRTGLQIPLGGVYLAWAGVVFLLYRPCRWFAGVKQRSRAAWLSYV